VASAIDAATAEAIEAFCEESPEVEAAYVRLTERTRRAPSLQLVQRLSRGHPDLMRRLGYGVSADRAVPAWERYGVKVFSRSLK
jgi:hypothetical protein